MNADTKLELPEKILQFSENSPVHESLIILQNYNGELIEILRARHELLTDLNFQRCKKETELKSLQFAIDNKRAEVEKVKLQLQKDWEAEDQCTKRLAATEEKRFTSVVKYQERMRECRNQLFMSVGVHEQTMRDEIGELENRLVAIKAEVEEAEYVLRQAEKLPRNVLASDIENTIDEIWKLNDDLAADIELEKECEDLERKLKNLKQQRENLSCRR